MLKMFLITGAGGFLGSGFRYLAQRLIAIYFPVSFPFGTLFVNVLGGFLIGVIYALGDKTKILTPELRIFLAVGVCGGFTTFSTFSLDAFGLLNDREYLYLTIYVVSSVLLSISATIAGVWIIKAL
jgi:fluoride exporter